MATYSGTPRTWTAGETVTAALMNSDVRDPLAALSGSWTSYTPTLSGFTAGNGVGAGHYLRVGKLVAFRAIFTFGTTSGAGAAIPQLTLPVTAQAGAVNIASLFGLWWDASGSQPYTAGVMFPTTTTIGAYVLGTAGIMGTPSSTSPFTWATSDEIRVGGVYEAA